MVDDAKIREVLPGIHLLHLPLPMKPTIVNVYLVDGGDEFQGTLASNLAYGRPVSGIYNRLGYAAAALGNHEFDWGTDTLRARMRDEHYDVLAANVRFTDGRDVPWIRDDTIVTRGPFTIGIIGVITRSTETAAKASNKFDPKMLVEVEAFMRSPAAWSQAHGGVAAVEE